MDTRPYVSDPEMARRAAQTFELFRVGVRLMRENLRHRYPDEPSEAIEKRLAEWILKDDEESAAGRGDAKRPAATPARGPAEAIERTGKRRDGRARACRPCEVAFRERELLQGAGSGFLA